LPQGFWLGFNNKHCPGFYDTSTIPACIMHLFFTAWVDAFWWNVEMNTNTPIVVYVLARSNFSYPHRQKTQPTVWALMYQKHFLKPTSLRSMRCEGNGMILSFWWPKTPLSNFERNSFAGLRFHLQSSTLCSKLSNLEPWSSKFLQTCSYSPSPSCTKDQKASMIVYYVSTFFFNSSQITRSDEPFNCIHKSCTFSSTFFRLFF